MKTQPLSSGSIIHATLTQADVTSTTTEVQTKATGDKGAKNYILVKDQGWRLQHFNWTSKDDYDLYNWTIHSRKRKHHDTLYGEQDIQGHILRTERSPV